MTILFRFVFIFIASVSFGQIPEYYSGINFDEEGLPLKDELSELIISTHTTFTSYSDVWNVLKVSDLDPTNAADVLLMYGYNDADGDVTTDRTRYKHNNGGSVGQWNREHVFPKSLGDPNLGTSGPGSDPHNLRASDVQANGNRGNRMFIEGTGNAGAVSGSWYPGDEWKGDAARIILYMYLRYGDRCLPSAVANGSINAVDANMINVLLKWNAEDEVSVHEDNRNDAIYDVLGNRNPFIDNPYLATLIWGESPAVDRWGTLSIKTSTPLISFQAYPNPLTENILHIQTNSTAASVVFYLTDVNGKNHVYTPIANYTGQYELAVDDLPRGIYFLTLVREAAVMTEKIILQ